MKPENQKYDENVAEVSQSLAFLFLPADHDIQSNVGHVVESVDFVFGNFVVSNSSAALYDEALYKSQI